MTLAISLDIETLSTNKNAVVLTIGATTISLDGSAEKTFYARLDPQEQIDMGRHVSVWTIRWWMGQTRAAQGATFEGYTLKAAIALEMLAAWLDEEGNPPIYTNGPAFDAAILESLAEDLKMGAPWSHRQNRDLRTVEETILLSKDEFLHERFYTLKDRVYSNMVAHNALDDAKAQGEIIRFWMKELRGD